MASLTKATDVWDPAENSGNRPIRKNMVDGISLKRFVFTMANAGHKPEVVAEIIRKVYGVRVTDQKGKSTADTVKKDSFKMWMRWGKKGTKDNGLEPKEASYTILPDGLVNKANLALQGKPIPANGPAK